MSGNPNADTHSPWFECFEPQEPAIAEMAQPAGAQVSPPADTDAAGDEPDGALEALFDYYNA